MGEHHLDNVPRGDVFFGPEHDGLKLLPGEVGGQPLTGSPRGSLAMGDGPAQALDDVMDFGDGLVVLLPEALLGGKVGPKPPP